MEFKLDFLETITNNFSDDHKVGSGGTGTVYRGLYNGEEIAVKRLHPLQGIDDKAFDLEFRSLIKVHHQNVVRLIGYCVESRKRFVVHNGDIVRAIELQQLLCFEYMPFGSLDKHILDASCNLDWPTCYKIITGTCWGLNHLHNATERPIYHLDLKPTNILLDKSMTAKIADTGLSRLIDPPEPHETEIFQRTQGYMPPEYIEAGFVSSKYDVFSLGVIIIKILAGNEGYFRCREMPREQFIELVIANWKRRLQGTSRHFDIQQVETCVVIGLRCVADDRHIRPSIKEIIITLESEEAWLKQTSQSSGLSEDLLARMEDMHTEFDMLESIVHRRQEPSNLKLPFLQFITKQFSNELKIGNGGCGVVYKGNLRQGIIAVKRLFKFHTIEDKMFHQEVQTMMKVKHENVVQFLGFCSHTEEKAVEINGKFVMAQVRERLLCFEYLGNGSLENYLADELRGHEWKTRYTIIKGICNGLHHLHRENGIIHMDLKPANILLDSNMAPKITDFGLSRFDDISRTMSSERLLSFGYCAPEYLDVGKMSRKSDIYSLGVIILELLTGSKKQPNITRVCRRWKHRWKKISGGRCGLVVQTSGYMPRFGAKMHS